MFRSNFVSIYNTCTRDWIRAVIKVSLNLCSYSSLELLVLLITIMHKTTVLKYWYLLKILLWLFCFDLTSLSAFRSATVRYDSKWGDLGTLPILKQSASNRVHATPSTQRPSGFTPPFIEWDLHHNARTQVKCSFHCSHCSRSQQLKQCWSKEKGGTIMIVVTQMFSTLLYF